MNKILVPYYDLDFRFDDSEFKLEIVRRALMSLRFYSKDDSMHFIMQNGKVVTASTFSTLDEVVNVLAFSIGRLEEIMSYDDLMSLYIVAKLYHDEGYSLLDEC